MWRHHSWWGGNSISSRVSQHAIEDNKGCVHKPKSTDCLDSSPQDRPPAENGDRIVEIYDNDDTGNLTKQARHNHTSVTHQQGWMASSIFTMKTCRSLLHGSGGDQHHVLMTYRLLRFASSSSTSSCCCCKAALSDLFRLRGPLSPLAMVYGDVLDLLGSAGDGEDTSAAACFSASSASCLLPCNVFPITSCPVLYDQLCYTAPMNLGWSWT